MEGVFLIAAWVGGILTGLLAVMAALGLDHSGIGEIDHPDHGTDEGQTLNLLSVRALSAAAGAFGMAGLVMLRMGLASFITVAGSLIIAFASALAVAWVMRWFKKAESDGSLNLQLGVGTTATVAVPIPPQDRGIGKIILTIQERSIECQATTLSSEALKTGSPVIVTGLKEGEIFEVTPYPTDPEVSP